MTANNISYIDNISYIEWIGITVLSLMCLLLFVALFRPRDTNECYAKRKSINKLFSQFLERLPFVGWYDLSFNFDAYEEYLITFKGWTAQEVYQKIKEHLESILEEYKNNGAFSPCDNHALANFLAEMEFTSDELYKFKEQKKRQKIDTKLSDFS